MGPLLLKNAQVYDPQPVGAHDLLLAAGRILTIAPRIEPPPFAGLRVLDLAGAAVVPGIIDGHVHIAGAGGEGGPETRTPEVKLTDLFEAGVTTVVGMLGTDGYTRTIASVLMKAKGLRADGASCWILTGAYQVPPPTITGSVATDLAYIGEVVGVGEVAVSDHRSSFPTVTELAKLAEQARVGAMLGGKSGVMCVHLGDAPEGVLPIQEVVRVSQVPVSQFLPTHCNRSRDLLEMCKAFGKQGGRVDITTGSYRSFPDEDIRPSSAIRELVDSGVPLDRITASSDGQGSLPRFDAGGALRGLTMASSSSLLEVVRDMINEEGFSLGDAFTVITSNVADVWQLRRKGRIREGCDADILVLDGTVRIRHLIARGVVVVEDSKVVRGGAFEGMKKDKRQLENERQGLRN
jgi:beta-aspartyl-dipeptidase (metallo-type)